MYPPSCPLTGKHIRWILLAGVISCLIYFLVHGFQEPPSERTVYMCDTGDTHEMVQCSSLEDVTSCSELVDADGNVVSCIHSSCGYRLFPHIDISIAGTPDPYDENAGTSPTSFVSVMSIFYGLVPYIMGFVYLVSFLASGGLTPLARLMVLGVIVLVNDFVFKKLWKQHRPEGSCLYFLSYGMPSGHAATSIGLLAYLLLEIFECHPNLLCGLTCKIIDYRNAYSFGWGDGWQRQHDDKDSANANDAPDAKHHFSGNISIFCVEADDRNKVLKEWTFTFEGQYWVTTNEGREPKINVGVSLEPLLPSPAQTCNTTTLPFGKKWLYHWYALGYFLLLFPVPFSRVYLHDHLRSQVLAGSAIGIVASMILYLSCIRTCAQRVIRWRSSQWGQWWGLKSGWGEGLF